MIRKKTSQDFQALQSLLSDIFEGKLSSREELKKIASLDKKNSKPYVAGANVRHWFRSRSDFVSGETEDQIERHSLWAIPQLLNDPEFFKTYTYPIMFKVTEKEDSAVYYLSRGISAKMIKTAGTRIETIPGEIVIGLIDNQIIHLFFRPKRGEEEANLFKRIWDRDEPWEPMPESSKAFMPPEGSFYFESDEDTGHATIKMHEPGGSGEVRAIYNLFPRGQ